MPVSFHKLPCLDLTHVQVVQITCCVWTDIFIQNKKNICPGIEPKFAASPKSKVGVNF